MAKRVADIRCTRYPFRGVLLVGLIIVAPGCNWIARVSVSSSGEQSNGASSFPAISGDGRYAVFASTASNLVAGDSNNSVDVFLRDTLMGSTVRVSVDSAGNQASGNTPVITSDGRYVAFTSVSSTLVTGDTNASTDVFLRDTLTGTTSRVSLDSSGAEGNSRSASPAISDDGRLVAFESDASNLVAGDLNARTDIFVRDTTAGTTARISVDGLGNEGDGRSTNAAISGDGRYVAFQSVATNLVADDTNHRQDIFVHDLETGSTALVSVDPAGNEGNGSSQNPALSDDGRFIAFDSQAKLLVAGDSDILEDVFVFDQFTGITTGITQSLPGDAFDYYQSPSLSGDGRFVLFKMSSTGPTVPLSGFPFLLHDRHTGGTTRVTQDAQGMNANYPSYDASISRDGRYVIFSSEASNLVPDDTNGGSDDVFIRAFPNVTVSAINPAVLPVGMTTPVTISGTYFLPEARPVINGAQTDNVVIVDENTLTADITVSADTPVGTTDVSVGLPGTGPGLAAGVIGNCVGCASFVAPSGC